MQPGLSKSRFDEPHWIIQGEGGITFSRKRGTTFPFRLVPLGNLNSVLDDQKFVYHKVPAADADDCGS